MASRVSIYGFRYIAQHFGMLVPFGACLFVSAGSWDWPRAWATLGACLVSDLVLVVLLAWRAPETLNQRGAGHGDLRSFDKVFAVLWMVLGWSIAIVAGLDCVRYGWCSLSWVCFVAGAGLIAVSTGVGTWAMLENEHFEQFVRIQRDRNHRVVTTGPYRIVRHPGYLAGILGAFAAPLLLGSAWSFVPACLTSVLLVWRTSREDRTLREELEGYVLYTEKTRHRLIPYVW